MSRTLFVKYTGDGFWAYDVAVGIFLKHLIDRAREEEKRHPAPWLSECIECWCVNAVISEMGLHLDPRWSVDQRRLVCSMIKDACEVLQKVDAIPEEEAASWKLLNGQGVFSRGAKRIPTAPAIELGRAIALLLEGRLPPSPAGTSWFYGSDQGISTLGKRTEPDDRPNAPPPRKSDG